MPRIPRVVVPGLPHHPPSPRLRRTSVTHRGNRRADVFLDDTDRRRYLFLLGQYAASHGLVARAEDSRGLSPEASAKAGGSAAAHFGLRPEALLWPVQMAWPVGDWSAYDRDDEDGAAAAIPRQTVTGRLCGSQPFVKKLESALGRLLPPRKRGSKPKKPRNAE